MEEWIQPFVFPLELLFAVIIYVLPLRLRSRGVLRCALVMALFLLVASADAWLLPFLSGNGDETMTYQLPAVAFQLLYIAGFVVMFLILLFGIWYCFDVEGREAVLCAAMGYATEHIAYCLRILVNGVTHSHIADSIRPCYLLIHFGVYLIFYFVFTRRMAKEHHYETDAVSSMQMMLVTLFVVLLMSLVASAFGFTFWHGVYGLICCLFIMINERNHIQQWNLQKEMTEKERLWMMNKAQYELSRENIELINRKCHDLKHQIGSLRTITDVTERQQLVDSIEDSVMIYDSILHTGNAIVDTVLTEKSLICNEYGIRMHGMIDGKLLFFMDAVDIYTLFGNALDNAIEANRKVAEDKRCISILIHEKVNLIFIQIENPYSGQLHFRHGLPLTDKPDHNYHGFGVGSIKAMAEKYGGFMTIETQQNIFVLRITIPRSR